MKYPNMEGVDHQPVASSTINTVGYDSEKRELHIDFHDSGMYVYQDVPPETYQGLMVSSSKGSFLHRYIKGRHQHVKV